MRKWVAAAAAAAMLLTAGCGSSEKPEKTYKKTYIPPDSTSAESSEVQDSSAEESAPDDHTDAEGIYDTAPLASAYLSGDSSGLDDTQKKILDKAAAVMEQCTHEGMTPYEKELAIHDWLIRNCTYDKGELRAIKEPGPHASDPYGALIDGEAICMGYTTAFKLFMDMAEIPCGIIHSVDSDGDEHAWNTVQLDGNWYYVDTTWDDPVPDEDPTRDIKHQFFNITKEEILIEHVLPEGSPDTESTAWLFATQDLLTVTDFDMISDGVKAAAAQGHSDLALYFDNGTDISAGAIQTDDYYLFPNKELRETLEKECSKAGFNFVFASLRRCDKGSALLIRFDPKEGS